LLSSSWFIASFIIAIDICIANNLLWDYLSGLSIYLHKQHQGYDMISIAKLLYILFKLLSTVFLVPLLRSQTVVMVKPLKYKQIEFFFFSATHSNMLFIISFWLILILFLVLSIFLSLESYRFGRSSRKAENTS
jgi:uncharacterized membrane protein